MPERWLGLCFTLYQQEIITLERQVSILVAKLVLLPFARCYHVRVVAKVETFITQLLGAYLRGFGGYQFFDDPPVAAKDIVDVADIIVGRSVKLIVVCVAAQVAAKFLVCAAMKGFSAFGTASLLHTFS